MTRKFWSRLRFAPLRAAPLLVIGAAIGVMATVYLVAERSFWSAELKRAEARTTLFRASLRDALERFQHLPYILARDPAVIAAAAPEHRGKLNRRLEDFARQSGVDALFFIDLSGQTVAASNHRDARTFIGQNYRFRPYFKAAIAGEHGEYYAIGATTLKPGYFIAEAVTDAAGRKLGAMVVKVDLNPLQRAWGRGGETLLVANSDGVVVLASEPRWLFTAKREIEADRRLEIAAARQFADQPLASLAWRAKDEDEVALDGVSYIHVAEPVGRLGWTLHYLADPRPVRERALLAVVTAAIALGLLILIALAVRSERLRAALRRSQQQRRALQSTNRALTRAQTELERASKMATLGQLAASVVHELGQPISAMRNHLAAAEIADRASATRETLSGIGQIVGRMENVTKQLKALMRSPAKVTEPVELREVIEGARFLLRHELEAAGVTLVVESDQPSPSVRGDRLRLEQVAVNLMTNAVAAMAGSATKTLTVSARREGDTARLEVADTGHGLRGYTLEELEEPFHTTHPSGKGMGLGLAIASEIVKEHGGVLSVRERAPSGAVFSVSLPPHAAELAEAS